MIRQSILFYSNKHKKRKITQHTNFTIIIQFNINLTVYVRRNDMIGSAANRTQLNYGQHWMERMTY